MQIPVLIEPAYDRSSVWCRQMRIGIEATAARKKHTVLILNSLAYRTLAWSDIAPERKLIVLVGTSPVWITEAMEFLSQRKISVILASYQPVSHKVLRGIVQMDYASATDMLLQYMRSCHKTKTALYGCRDDSSTDEIKKSTFLRFLATEGVPKHSAMVFDNNTSLERCYKDFRQQYHCFDSIICANDIAAASLMMHLMHDGIAVPETLSVATFGNSEIARLFSPGITTASLDHEAVGEQIVSLYGYVARNQSEAQVSVQVPSHLIVRQSTGGILPDAAAPLPQKIFHVADDIGFYQDPEVQSFSNLETMLMVCDSFDRAILKGLLGGDTYEGLAERLDAPLTTVRYRIRRMIHEAGANSRKEFEQWLRNNEFTACIQWKESE